MYRSFRLGSVTLTWRFQSNDDGVNGNAGLAGFAVDNIRIDEFTFEDDGTYINDINGLDASERKTLRWRRMTSNREFIELMQQHYSIVQLKTHHGIIKPRLPPQIITPKLSSVSQAQT